MEVEVRDWVEELRVAIDGYPKVTIFIDKRDKPRIANSDEMELVMRMVVECKRIKPVSDSVVLLIGTKSWSRPADLERKLGWSDFDCIVASTTPEDLIKQLREKCRLEI